MHLMKALLAKLVINVNAMIERELSGASNVIKEVIVIVASLHG